MVSWGCRNKCHQRRGLNTAGVYSRTALESYIKVLAGLVAPGGAGRLLPTLFPASDGGWQNWASWVSRRKALVMGRLVTGWAVFAGCDVLSLLSMGRAQGQSPPGPWGVQAWGSGVCGGQCAPPSHQAAPGPCQFVGFQSVVSEASWLRGILLPASGLGPPTPPPP